MDGRLLERALRWAAQTRTHTGPLDLTDIRRAANEHRLDLHQLTAYATTYGWLR